MNLIRRKVTRNDFNKVAHQNQIIRNEIYYVFMKTIFDLFALITLGNTTFAVGVKARVLETLSLLDPNRKLSVI